MNFFIKGAQDAFIFIPYMVIFFLYVMTWILVLSTDKVEKRSFKEIFLGKVYLLIRGHIIIAILLLFVRFIHFLLLDLKWSKKIAEFIFNYFGDFSIVIILITIILMVLVISTLNTRIKGEQ